MIGQVYKIHSDFYYVHTEHGIVECKLRDILKKQKIKILVGDFVELEQYNENSKQAFISSLVDRTNYISRPSVANVTQAIIVSSIKEPDLDYEQLDRYIALCEFHKITPILCFNKEDLVEDDEIVSSIKNVYSSLSYEIIFTSALSKEGVDSLFPLLKDNITIFCGASGVGKSSIIKLLANLEKIRIKDVSEKTKRGVHTTRHCEIIQIEKDVAVVDSPGFSQVKFDFLMPQDVQNLFPEFVKREGKCKFKDCLHMGETGCSYSDTTSKMPNSRYESYKKFVEEAKEYKKMVTYSGKKEEKTSKNNQNRVMTKISSKKRNLSRKVLNQSIYQED